MVRNGKPSITSENLLFRIRRMSARKFSYKTCPVSAIKFLVGSIGVLTVLSWLLHINKAVLITCICKKPD
ncbi:hypothetical protein XELAEV_18022347mg [Xenopus laevis]|uniref:Uncharacterized protein n=1 Tax=Xenopus laevis TaxID=8355 RepID=A0A974D430_XENLA|nr:hypothetical protein XELAEV_18022347mg [Xenopus laevis]